MSERKQASSFLQRYLQGEVLSDEIDDFIDAWHEKPGRKKIFEFLGMTKEEYALWLRDPDGIAEITRARQEKLPLVSVVRDALAKLATAESPRAKPLAEWLERYAPAHSAK